MTESPLPPSETLPAMRRFAKPPASAKNSHSCRAARRGLRAVAGGRGAARACASLEGLAAVPTEPRRDRVVFRALRALRRGLAARAALDGSLKTPPEDELPLPHSMPPAQARSRDRAT